MKNFLKTVVASLVGVLIGFFIFSFIGMVMIGAVAGSMGSSKPFTLKEKTILRIDLNGSFNDRKTDNPFSSFSGLSSTGIDDILSAIKKAKENEKVKGIYLRCKDLSGGIASLEPVRNALVDFKESGKFIVSYSDSYNQGTYYLASPADKIVLNPQGQLDFQGLSMRLQFERGMYEKLGIQYEVFKVGTFKSAVEPYIQDKMSNANREQTESYLNDIWSHILGKISESRHIPVATLNEYADKFLGFYEADSVVEFGMVDTLIYAVGVEKYLKELIDVKEEEKLNFASVKNINSIPEVKAKKSKDVIAVLYAEGIIVMKEEKNNFLSGNTFAAKKYITEIQKLKEAKNVKAVVFRVNSPGGSVYASEQIWNSIEELKKEKPVIVSMGDYAASAGYYISCNATTIVAEPTTLTGSIGIFALFPNGEELSKKMGVTFDEATTNKHGGFGGQAFGIPMLITAKSRAFNNEESKMLQSHIERGYDLFITRCADGRSKTKEEIDAIGQGRVWTGKQALSLGLVDELGSLDDAIKIAVEAAGLEGYTLKNYPEKTEFFAELLKSAMGESTLKMARFVMGEEAYNHQKLMQTLRNAEICVAEMPDRISF